MKAQAAIEFLTSYGWALLAVIALALFAFYFLSTLQQTPPQCDFGSEFPCKQYQFFKKPDGTMRLTFQITNGVGKDIKLYNKKQVLMAENVGKSGSVNYTGNCTGPADIVKPGDVILCIFDINDKQVVPSVGKAVKFSVLLNYTSCLPSAFPCANGTNRTFYGKIVKDLELMPAGIAPYCMDGTCNTTAGENYTNCPWDCPPPRPKTVVITSTADCAYNFLDKDTEVYEINVTVYDKDGIPLKGVPVFIFPQDSPGFEDTVIHITSYTITPPLPITDSNGLARANFSWHSCDCCFSSCYALFDLAATAGDVTVYWPHCAMLNRSDVQSLGCC